MRILHILQRPQLRGAELFASQLARELTHRGHQVKLVFLFKGPGGFISDVDCTYLDLTGPIKSLDVAGWRSLASVIREFRADIVQANAADTLKYAVSSRLIFPWSGILVYRNANLSSHFIRGFLHRAFNRFLLSKADHIVSVSARCAADIRSVFHIPAEQNSVIEIGVDPVTMLGLPEDVSSHFNQGPVFIHVGGFVSEKNHFGLIRIFKMITAECNDSRLMLVGNGELLPRIRTFVHDLGLQENVVFLGARRDVRDIMPHATALLMPSLIEGLPGVILEAMYARCPVLAYDCGGISDVVSEQETGWLFRSGDEAGMARAAIDMAKDLVPAR